MQNKPYKMYKKEQNKTRVTQ